MKVAALIIAVFGVLNSLSLLGLFRPHARPWPFLLAASVLGVFMILIAIGIWMRHVAAWRLGFLAIALCGAYSVADGWFRLPAGSANGKAVLMIAWPVGVILVATYWSVVWYRQKKWFEPESVDRRP